MRTGGIVLITGASSGIGSELARVFGEIEKALVVFLKERGAELKAECYLPAVVDALIKDGKAKARVLPTSDPWYGLTYPEDKAFVYEQIHKLVFKKVYPEKLW
jgi:NAD(P)-dependent dehydrogenase (short-subunit alcohol dehydrogenase family)